MILPKINFKSFFVLALISTAVLTSCKDNEEVKPIENNTPQEATLEQKKQALENVVPATNTAGSSGDVALNPAHGQPGHSCKIPVGAPLNGSAGTQAAPIKMDMNKTNTTPSAASGINPPHGQPGHRCDVKVGDPL